MQKLINHAANFVDEALEGLVAVHSNQWKFGPYARTIVRAHDSRPGKVGIVTGGGFGHLPLFLGYVGEGLVDACAVGNVFSSPPSDAILACTKAVDSGRGVLHLIGNYQGDTMNFALAQEDAEDSGIAVIQIAAGDDVASAPRHGYIRRRGVAGLFFAYKIAGAAAESGLDLSQVAEVTNRALEGMATMGVGLSPCINPAAGEPNFILADGEMEIGVGIHGEPGVGRQPLESADQICDRLMDAVVKDLSIRPKDRVAILINGLGATPREELYVVARRAVQWMESQEISISRSYVGEYVTSLEMAGASITLMKLDNELEELLLAPAESPMFIQTATGWIGG